MSLSEGAATRNGLLLERRRRPIEHEHGINVQEKQLAQPAEEAENGCVLQHLARIVTHRLDELDQPDGRVDSEPFPCERLQRHAAAARGEEVPESRDAHLVHAVFAAFAEHARALRAVCTRRVGVDNAQAKLKPQAVKR